MGGDAVAVERDRAAGRGEQRQQGCVALGGDVGEQLEPRVHIGDGGGSALRGGENLLLAGILDRLACPAVQAGERRARRERDAAEFGVTREQGAPLGRPFAHRANGR